MTNARSDFSDVVKTFEQMPERAFSKSALLSIFEARRLDWQLPQRMRPQALLDRLLKETQMTEVKLKSSHYEDLVRYAWGAQTAPIHLALSIKRAAYCTHGTAMHLHGLGGDQWAIFVNSEQSDKNPPDSELTQEAIDRAFRNKQRASNLIYKYRKATITVLSGKHSGRLGVQRLKTTSGEEVDVTSLERTLIDITVRPLYAGGVPHVLEAFRRARERVSTDILLHFLKKLALPSVDRLLHETQWLSPLAAPSIQRARRVCKFLPRTRS